MWRSLVAHLTGGQGVAGSNPVIPTHNRRSEAMCSRHVAFFHARLRRSPCSFRAPGSHGCHSQPTVPPLIYEVDHLHRHRGRVRDLLRPSLPARSQRGRPVLPGDRPQLPGRVDLAAAGPGQLGWRVHRLVILPVHRRLGIATELLNFAADLVAPLPLYLRTRDGAFTASLIATDGYWRPSRHGRDATTADRRTGSVATIASTVVRAPAVAGCAFCGLSLTATRSDARVCSGRCRVAPHRAAPRTDRAG